MQSLFSCFNFLNRCFFLPVRTNAGASFPDMEKAPASPYAKALSVFLFPTAVITHLKANKTSQKAIRISNHLLKNLVDPSPVACAVLILGRYLIK